MDISKLMAIFSDPNSIHSLSSLEKLQGTLFTVAMGMGVTFVVLVVLQFCIILMPKMLGVNNTTDEQNTSNTNSTNTEEEVAVAISVAALVADVPVDRVVVTKK